MPLRVCGTKGDESVNSDRLSFGRRPDMIFGRGLAEDAIRRLFVGRFTCRPVRNRPGFGPGEEGCRVLYMVVRQHRLLDAEEVLRKTLVQADSGRHFRGGLNQAGHQAAIRLENRVVFVYRIEVRGSIVGVNGCLHRTPDIVKPGARAEVIPKLE